MKIWVYYLVLLLSIFSSLTSAESKIYHWVDENGKNHFSDTASPGSNTEEINIRQQNLLINDNNEFDESQPVKLQLAPSLENQEITEYHTEITTPKDQSTLRNNEGTLNIQVNISPEKNSDHVLQLYIDGEKIGEPQLSTTIRAFNIFRGTHQLQVYLLDKTGKVLTKTQIVTIYFHQTIAKQTN